MSPNITLPRDYCDTESEVQLKTLLLFALSGFLIVSFLGIAALAFYWDNWYADIASHAFEHADHDGSGSVDEEELYMAVLRLYAKLPIKVHTPTRQSVLTIVTALDLDRHPRWHLGKEEFAHVMAVLSAQLLGRLTLTLMFLLACPILGGIFWTLLQDAPLTGSGALSEGLRRNLPVWLRCTGSVLTQLHLGPPLITVILMLPLNSLVNLMELQLYKILHFSCWCWGARTAQAEYRQDLHTLARKSLIITTMTRRASSKSAPLLSERMSRGL